MQETKYFCAKCGKELSPNEKPCTECDSIRRNVQLHLIDKVTLHELIRAKQKRKFEGKTKIIHEQKVGDELFKKKNKWRIINRVLDHLNDKYTELILDKKTGRTVVNKTEKLSKHWNHGSAKKKNSYS